MALQNVKCSVSNCIYWQNNLCNASAIEVNVDNGGNRASNSVETQCQTFEQNK